METNRVTEILKEEFILRCKKNPSYSVRSFAMALNVDHSLLSKILRGQRPLSRKMALHMAESLNISIAEMHAMIDSSEEKYPSQTISEDVFIVMADWYHFAILELIKTDGFKPSVEYIAQVLDISVFEAESALKRLGRLGFINITDKEIQIIKKNNNWFDQENTNDARKVLQKQLLKKSLDAIDSVPFEKRNHSGLTISIGSQNFQKYQNEISRFIRVMDEMSEVSRNKNEVYQLCVSFFPLNKELS